MPEPDAVKTDPTTAVPASPVPVVTEGLIEPIPSPEPKKEPDLKVSDMMQRVTKEPAAKKEPSVLEELSPELKLTRERILEATTDPEQKRLFEEKYQEADRGIQAKFQEIAEIRKQAAPAPSAWTPERVSDLLKDPNFVQSANAIIGSQPQTEGTEDFLSVLGDEEKAAFNLLRKEAKEANTKVDQLLTHQNQMMNTQEHEQLKVKYSDYDQTQVDNYMQQVVDGKKSTMELKELVYKGTNFESLADRIYKLGYQDGKGGLQEKMAGTSQNLGLTVNEADDQTKPHIEEGERPSKFFVRLAQHNLLRK